MRISLPILALSLLVGACGSSESNEPNKAHIPSSKGIQTIGTTESVWPRRIGSPALNRKIEENVSSVLARLSIEEKVGQIIQPEIRNVSPDDIRKYHLGAVLNGGGTTPNNDKYAKIEDWVDLADQFYNASMDESDGKIGIPLLWGSDAVHGNNNLFGATLFPHNIGLGAANDPELIERIGKITALELSVTGLDWTFGPTVAVVRDDRWGRTYESYSESPEIVTAYAKMMVKGIQGSDDANQFAPGNIIATAKHFLGDGGTTNGIDRGDTAVDENELMSVHGAGYISALDSNVLTTMASFNSWNGKKLHGHKYLLTDVLKGQLGFNGFVVGDWNGHRQIPGCTVVRCPEAINAGLDMFMVPEDWRELYQNTLADVKNGAIPISRLNDAVRRILRVKFQAGLFSAGPVKQRPQISKADLVGSPVHRLVAREAVRKSLVLLKNNKGVLPIQPKKNVLIAGAAANNIGQQSGGWTLSWQGTDNTNKDFPGATSIFDGLAQAINKIGGQAVLSEDGRWTKDDFKGQASPDLAVVVIGEEPYAEWHGDIANIEYQAGTKTDLALLKTLKAQGIPVITVFISGRPLWVNKELNASDAFVAAWLPGSEGNGIADVLIADANGKPNYDFQGRLSFSWPKRSSQTNLNIGQADYDPLFPYGHGLSYVNPVELTNNLDESSIRQAQDPIPDVWVFVSRTNSPWQIHLRPSDAQSITVSGNSAGSKDGKLMLTSVDKESQEDARRIKWNGPGVIAFSTPIPLDLSDLEEAGGTLQFDIKVNQIPSGEVNLAMNCDTGCEQSRSLTTIAKSKEANKWQKLSFDLGCFTKSNQDLGSVRDIFTLESTGLFDVSLANIKVVKKSNDPNDKVLSCD